MEEVDEDLGGDIGKGLDGDVGADVGADIAGDLGADGSSVTRAFSTGSHSSTNSAAFPKR